MIFAGIVTYNPDIERLTANLAAISVQVERVVIYDNNSDNLSEIRACLSRINGSGAPGGEPIVLVETQANSGLAVALNFLARYAREEGASALLLLDQDSVAAGDLVAVEHQLLSPRVGIVSPLVIDRNGVEDEPLEDLVYEVKRTITSGSLLNLEAHEDVDGYDERLFVDWVDFEYCDRLRTHGYTILRTHRTSLLHELGKQELVFSLPDLKCLGKMRGWHFYRTNHSPRRRFDRARSQAITIAKYRHTPIGREERTIFLQTVLLGLLLEKLRLRLLTASVNGYLAGRAAFKETEAQQRGRVS